MKSSLSLFYFLFYAFVSIPFALYPLHLENLKFTPLEIGSVAAALNLAIMLGAVTSLRLVTNKPNKLRLILRGCTLLALVFFAPLLFSTDFWSTACLIFASSFFFKGAGSLIDALSVRASFQNSITFEHVRVWGSIGFIVCLWCVGPLVDYYGTEAIVLSGIVVLLGLSICSFAVANPKPLEYSQEQIKQTGSTRIQLLGPFPLLLFTVFLNWASSAVMATYLSVYLRDLGWSATLISSAFVAGVILEIALFVVHPRLERRFSLTTLYQFSMLLTVLRWIIMALTKNPILIFVAQGLHGFTFGGTYMSSVKLTYTYLPDHKRDQGQGWYAFFGSGLGNLTGRIVVTSFAASITSYSESIPSFFAVSSAVAAVGFLLSLALPRSETGRVSED